METSGWKAMLVAALLLNAALGFGYRVYRLSKGGPMGDVVGQALLAAVLVACALTLALGGTWARWPALVYGVVFALIVMPVWVLSVLIPLRPRWPDHAFTAIYWVTLGVIVVSSLAL